MQTAVELIRLLNDAPSYLVFAATGLLGAIGSLFLIAIRTGRSVELWQFKIGPATLPRRRSGGPQRPPATLEGEGRRLFEYAGYYPIDIARGTDRPFLNHEIFVRAMKYLTSDISDRIAAMDLVYLREHNLRFFGDVLGPDDTELHNRLVARYHLDDFRRHVDRDDERLFANYKRLVSDIGRTFKGTHVEIVLHNVRNPLRSVIAAYGTAGISDRQVNDPSTRFVVQYVRNQGRLLYEALESGAEIAYLKQFRSGKRVKATTVPIYDQELGLIGLLCINIDIEYIKGLDSTGRKEFIESLAHNSGHSPIFERESPGQGDATSDSNPPVATPSIPTLGTCLRLSGSR